MEDEVFDGQSPSVLDGRPVDDERFDRFLKDSERWCRNHEFYFGWMTKANMIEALCDFAFYAGVVAHKSKSGRIEGFGPKRRRSTSDNPTISLPKRITAKSAGRTLSEIRELALEMDFPQQ